MFSKLFGITTKSFLFDNVTSHTHLATCMGISWLKLTPAPPMGHVYVCITSCMVDVCPTRMGHVYGCITSCTVDVCPYSFAGWKIQGLYLKKGKRANEYKVQEFQLNSVSDD